MSEGRYGQKPGRSPGRLRVLFSEPHGSAVLSPSKILASSGPAAFAITEFTNHNAGKSPHTSRFKPWRMEGSTLRHSEILKKVWLATRSTAARRAKGGGGELR